jgi:hypothetical protein
VSDDPTWDYFQNRANRDRVMDATTEDAAAEALGLANPVGYIEALLDETARDGQLYRLNTTTGRLAERLPVDVDTSDGMKHWLTWSWHADDGLTFTLLDDTEVADWAPVEVRPVDGRE